MTLTYRSSIGRRLTVTEGDGNIYELSLKGSAVDIFNIIPATFHSSITARTGTADLTSYLQSAIDSGKDVIFRPGIYHASTLTQSTNLQALVCNGIAQIVKNGNGDLFTASGDNVLCRNISWRGEASTTAYTGHGAVFTGDDPVLINCGSRWISSRALKCTGAHVQVIGTCDIYYTSDTSSNAYDIEIGVSGTATLYHELIGIYSSHAGGGILMTDVGGHHIQGGQFGKLDILAGTSPAGVNGGNILGSRILGNVNVGLSNASFAGNTFGAVTVTFSTGTASHSFTASNLLDASATLTDNSNNSVVVDRRQIPWQSYTPSWTAATLDPVIGNGSLTAMYSKVGRNVIVALQGSVSSTTSTGNGAWFLSLPFIPDTTISAIGACRMLDSGTNVRTGVVRGLTDGTARCQIFADSATTANASSIPFTWANGDSFEFTLSYST